MINKKQIFKLVELDQRHGVYKFKMFSPFFQKDVVIWIFATNNVKKNDITDRIIDRINSFLNIDKSEMLKIKDEIWKHYETCTRATDYGIDNELLKKHNNDYEKANKEHFGFIDSEDTFKIAKIDYVYFDDYVDNTNLYFSIWFNVVWENEHGLTMFFKNSKLESIE